VTVAPLTTTVMGAVDPGRAGVASGVNNAVARVAGLLAVAVLSAVLVRTFDARVRSGLDRLSLTPAARTAIDRELPKMAGAQLESTPSIEPSQLAAARRIIDDAFLSSFRRVMIGAAALAFAAAVVGVAIR
jgi:hypothetical protein